MIWIFMFFMFFTTSISAQEPIDTDGDGFRNISTLEELRWVSEHSNSWNWNFELDKNINASNTKEWNDGKGFAPIGFNYNNYFSGEFDGNGHLIDSLYINRPKQNYIGLFGFITQSKILNLGVTNCFIIGKDEVGSLVGSSFNSSEIFNCFNSGNVIGMHYTGGLVGINSQKSKINYCYNEAKVNGYTYVGGIAGKNINSSLVNKCFSIGILK